jgi:hypothetical protein
MNLWNGIIFGILSLVGLFIALLIYDYFSFLNQSSTKIFSPYILSIKPILIQNGGTVSISLLDLRQNISTTQYISLFLLPPDNDRVLLTNNTRSDKVNYSNPLKIDKTIDSEGNNTIIVVNNTNSEVLASEELVAKPSIILLLDFILNRGLGLLFVIVVPLITIAVQRWLKIRDENSLRQEQKAKWMDNYMKYYIDVANRSLQIYRLFQKQENNKGYSFDSSYKKDNDRIERCIRALSEFHENHEKLIEAVNTYKFETLVEEDFIANLDGFIRREIGNIFRPYDLHIFNDIQANAINDILRQKVKEWLENIHKVKLFYKLNFVYYWVVYTAITDTLLISYVDRNQRKNELEENLKASQFELRHFIHDLNYKFYEKNQKRYYDIFKRFKRWYKKPIPLNLRDEGGGQIPTKDSILT